jgi:hypothetical protein
MTDRYQFGVKSEAIVREDLKARGWNVEPWGRRVFSDGLNRMLIDWRDSYSRPCGLCWQPDFIVWRAEHRAPSNLYGVEVKRVTKKFSVERRALETYLDCERVFALPVVLVFHLPSDDLPSDDLMAIAAGKVEINTLPHFGNSEAGSGAPYFDVDADKLSPMERFFGTRTVAQ